MCDFFSYSFRFICYPEYDFAVKIFVCKNWRVGSKLVKILAIPQNCNSTKLIFFHGYKVLHSYNELKMGFSRKKSVITCWEYLINGNSRKRLSKKLMVLKGRTANIPYKRRKSVETFWKFQVGHGKFNLKWLTRKELISSTERLDSFFWMDIQRLSKLTIIQHGGGTKDEIIIHGK